MAIGYIELGQEAGGLDSPRGKIVDVPSQEGRGEIRDTRRNFMTEALAAVGLGAVGAKALKALNRISDDPARLRVVGNAPGYTDLEATDGRGKIRFMPLVHRNALGHPVQIDTSLIPEHCNIVVTEAGGDSPFAGSVWQFIETPDLSPLIDWMEGSENRMVAVSDFSGTMGNRRSMQGDMTALGVETLAGTLALKEAAYGTSSVRLTKHSPVHEIGETRRGAMALLAAFVASGPGMKFANFLAHSLGMPGQQHIRSAYAMAQDIHPEMGRWTAERDAVMAYHASYLLRQLREDPRSKDPSIVICAGADHVGIVGALQEPTEQLLDRIMGYRDAATEYDREHGFLYKDSDQDMHRPDSVGAIPFVRPGSNKGSVSRYVMPVDPVLERIGESPNPLARHMVIDLQGSQSVDLVTGKGCPRKHDYTELLARIVE